MSGGISKIKPSVYSLLLWLLEEQASKTSKNCALEFYPNVRFTYYKLNEISNFLACYLKDYQAISREIMGIYLEKTHILVITVLALLKASMA